MGKEGRGDRLEIFSIVERNEITQARAPGPGSSLVSSLLAPCSREAEELGFQSTTDCLIEGALQPSTSPPLCSLPPETPPIPGPHCTRNLPARAEMIVERTFILASFSGYKCVAYTSLPASQDPGHSRTYIPLVLPPPPALTFRPMITWTRLGWVGRRLEARSTGEGGNGMTCKVQSVPEVKTSVCAGAIANWVGDTISYPAFARNARSGPLFDRPLCRRRSASGRPLVSARLA